MTKFGRYLLAFAEKHPLAAFLIVITLLLAPTTVHQIRHPPTADEIKTYKENLIENQQKETAAHQIEQHKFLLEKYTCRQIEACEKYADVRQQCATAGDFGNCIKVKMGDESAQLIGGCTNDGKSLIPKEDVPNPLRCWVLNNVD
jgi:hypothetical protein